MTGQELPSQSEVLPPWQQYPEIERYSSGWRMGAGEDYMNAWYEWAETLSQEQLIEYFQQFLPIPLTWLDWVVARLGYECNTKAELFDGVQWLEQLGLADFSEFMSWYDEND